MKINKVLESFENEIGKLSYNKYFKNIKIDEKKSNNDVIYFEAPNQFIANWIKTKYLERLINLFEITTNNKPQIIIKVKNNSKNTPIRKKTQSQNQATFLNPFYTFENFVVGPSNQFAYTAAKSVAQKPGKLYNPIFIYGPTGLGKTHLAQAVGNEALKNGKKTIYISVEQLLNDFTNNLKNKTMDKFREKYRNCDFLIIDDVQFLTKKIQLQEEFFHTFNELHNNGKQIILTSDKPPKVLSGLEDRLKSRFEWGLIADISIPELETKIAIIKKKCELNGITLNEKIIEYIASNMGENIREIEGAITNINAYASLMGQEITLEFAKNIIKNQINESKKEITLEQIIETISKEFNIKPSEIKSKKRNKKIVEARRIGIYLARTLTPNSTPMLANFFGMKDHTAISHNMKKIDELLNNDENFKLKVEEIKNKILQK